MDIVLLCFVLLFYYGLSFNTDFDNCHIAKFFAGGLSSVRAKLALWQLSILRCNTSHTTCKRFCFMVCNLWVISLMPYYVPILLCLFCASVLHGHIISVLLGEKCTQLCCEFFVFRFVLLWLCEQGFIRSIHRSMHIHKFRCAFSCALFCGCIISALFRFMWLIYLYYSGLGHRHWEISSESNQDIEDMTFAWQLTNRYENETILFCGLV